MERDALSGGCMASGTYREKLTYLKKEAPFSSCGQFIYVVNYICPQIHKFEYV